MGLSARLLIGGVAAGAALAYYVKKRHLATGDSYLDIVAQLPSAARRSVSGMKQRATLALEEGKTAARARDAELSGQLEAPKPAPLAATPTHPGS